MVQPNNRVYPISWVSREKYEAMKNQLNQLSKQTNTDIIFNEKEQFFEIKGRSTKTVEEVTKLILDRLIPVLYRDLDLLRGTGPPSIDYKKAMADISNKQNISQNFGNSPNPSNPEEVSDSEDDNYSDDSEYSYSDDSLDYMRPKKNNDKGKNQASQSEAMKKKANETHGSFTFAKNVKNPEDILFGPPYEAMAAADYLWVIGCETGTECSLDSNKTVQIFGYSESKVQSAIEKFRFLQSLYKRLRRPTVVTPCIHYRTEGEYRLNFCDLHDYVDESSVALPRNFQRPAYVLIPSFKDPKSGNFMRPKGLSATAQMDSSKQQQKQIQKKKTPKSIYDELDDRFSEAHISSPNAPQSPLSWSSGQFNERTSAPSGETPLWGEQKYTTSPSKSASRGRGGGRGGINNSFANRSGTQETPRWGTPPPVTVANDDFPALGSGSSPSGRGRGQQHRGGATNGRGRRVMRLTPQKAPKPDPTKYKSMLTMAKEYNMFSIKEALSDSLETARQFRGEVTLKAKLGKVLWKNIPKEVGKSKIWNYTDIKDVCMKELKIQPTFNNVTITRGDIAQTVWRAVEQAFGPSIKSSSFFEIHVDGRSKASEPMKPAVLYTEASWANFFKVDLMKHTLTEIDWVSLDSKFDFQMSLQVNEIGRKEVSPFKPFIRRVALRPSSDGKTNALAYQNVGEGRLLKVKDIYHKQVSLFNVSKDVVLKMTRIENVPSQIETTGSEAKYSATTGRGFVGFDIELLYKPYEEMFKQNIDKPIFEDTQWTKDDIFGQNDHIFTRFMSSILHTMNILEKALD